MEESPEKAAFIEGLLKMASERWGREEVERLRPSLEMVAETIWTLEGFPLEPFEEPEGPAGEV